MPFFDLTLPTVLTRIAVLMPILAVAGLAAALAARLLGDEGPAQDGRATLNPFAHLDLIGALAFVIGALGWARPLDLDPGRLRGGRASALLVVAAPTLGLLALALAAVLLLPLAARVTTGGGVSMLAAGLASLARGAVGFALFNLLPVLPLAAGYLVDAALPGVARRLRDGPLLPALALLALVASGLPGQLLGGPVTGLLRLMSGGAGILASGI